MNTSRRTIQMKSHFLPVTIAGITCLFCIVAMPLDGIHAGEIYVSGCATLVCGDRDQVLNSLITHDEEGKEPTQVTLCHVESNKKNGTMHTIRVDQSFEDAHMKHGDTLGECVDTVMQAFVASLPTCEPFPEAQR